VLKVGVGLGGASLLSGGGGRNQELIAMPSATRAIATATNVGHFAGPGRGGSATCAQGGCEAGGGGGIGIDTPRSYRVFANALVTPAKESNLWLYQIRRFLRPNFGLRISRFRNPSLDVPENYLEALVRY
jgi:hypothetical protein